MYQSTANWSWAAENVVLCTQTGLSTPLRCRAAVQREPPCYCGVRRLATVEGKKRRKAMKRRSTRAARGGVSLLCCLSERAGLRLAVFSVWPRSAALLETWISLTSAFDVQSSLTSLCPPEKLLMLTAKAFTRLHSEDPHTSSTVCHLSEEHSDVVNHIWLKCRTLGSFFITMRYSFSTVTQRRASFILRCTSGLQVLPAALTFTLDCVPFMSAFCGLAWLWGQKKNTEPRPWGEIHVDYFYCSQTHIYEEVLSD